MYSSEVKNKFPPRLRSLEEFRIKRYLPVEKRFDEQDTADYQVQRETFLFYLNDNDGDTYFSTEDLYIRPRTGKY